MKPGVPQILFGGAVTLGTSVAPHLNASYAVGSLSTVALLSIFAAQEFDRAADVLVTENNAIRALFIDAAQTALSADLKAKLKSAGDGKDESFRVSALEEGNATLKTLLITLHETVETTDADWARAMDKRIWSILKQGADARALMIPPT